MSITRIMVANFQSLRRVDLELGTFTVIVGPSSSGKSALVRAFKALASNVRGSGVITRGEKAMAITARTNTHTITLERTDRSGTYRLFNGTDLTDIAFTKLAGEVPPAITQALRIDPVGEGGSVNFAGQFDKPFLLDESGATVARVLGELTNVTTIFAAVRTANRIRAASAATLKTRRADLGHIKTRLASFDGLQDRVRALAEAEQLNTRREALAARIGRLETALRTVRIAERAITKAAVPDVPASTELDTTFHRYLDLQAKLRGLTAKQTREQITGVEVWNHTGAIERMEQHLADMIQQAGTCPTCGQSTC